MKLDRQLINVDGVPALCAQMRSSAGRGRRCTACGYVDVSLREAWRGACCRGSSPAGVDARRLLGLGRAELVRPGHVPDRVRLRGARQPARASSTRRRSPTSSRRRPHNEGEEIMAAVAADPEREADVFEELEDSHQLEFVGDRSDDRDPPAARAHGDRRTPPDSRPAASRGAARGRDRRFSPSRLAVCARWPPTCCQSVAWPGEPGVRGAPSADATREEALERGRRPAPPADAPAPAWSTA